jgi:phenylalanyl-tRNA synthetase alpha chain
MLKKKPPIYIVVPGHTFRLDTVDAIQSANFHQFEVFCVDENVTVCNLKSVLDHFLRALFGSKTEARLHSSFFSFIELSFEIYFCSPSVGKLSNQWIEFLGCGIVDPHVLEAMHIDSQKYSGLLPVSASNS